MATPDPSNVAPWYLRNINQALALDEASGNVFVRTGFEGNIIISGNVNIPGTVTVDSSAEDPVHVHLDEIGTSGILTVPWMPVSIDGNSAVTITSGNIKANVTGSTVSLTGNLAGITGNVNIGTMPNVNAAISGTVAVSGITGNIAGITSNVNIGTMPNVNTNITNANIQVTQGTSPWVVSGNVNATLTGNSQVQITGQNLDAFARLRVSNPYTFFDSALTGERRYDWSSATATSGTVTFDYNANVRNLNVTAASGSEVIRESVWTFPYQAGKSLLVMSSFCMEPSKTGLRQRVGYFGASNGVYFEQTNGTKNMVIRSSSSGSLVEERIPQSNWNTDRLNGAGPSGITLDTNATQIFWCDIEWLGVGTVRTGFVINGQFIVCHTFNHANDPTYSTTYMGSATLPCRYEITNTSSTASVSTMKQICTTVISEGGYNMPAATYSAGTGTNVKRLTTAGTYYPIVSIRMNSSYLNSIVKVGQIDVLSPTVNYYRWVLLRNATLTSATWTGPGSTTRVDVDTGATAVSGGIEMQSGFASSRELAQLAGATIYAQLGRTLAGVSDTFTLALAATSNNADVLAQIGWQEIL